MENTHKGSSTDLGSEGTEIWRIKLQARGADHSQETEARWLEKGKEISKKPEGQGGGLQRRSKKNDER